MPQTKLTVQKEYRNLVEECAALLSERKFDLAMKDIEWRHELGETIVKSKAHQRFGKGRGEFIKRLAKDIGISRSSLYECVNFYEKYPVLSTVVETSTGKKILKWSDIRGFLTEEKRGCPHSETEIETLTIKRTRCVRCGKILAESKEKK